MTLGDLGYELKGLFRYTLCTVVFGHDWRPYEHWEFDAVGGGYVCPRCERGRPWNALTRIERQVADEKVRT
jgi:hypothetical protein